MVKRKYTKLKKKGEGWELTKILSYAIGLIVFFAVIFAFYTNAPAITKGLKSLQTKGVEVGYDITVGTMLVLNDKKFAEQTAKSDPDEWISFKEDYIQKNKN